MWIQHRLIKTIWHKQICWDDFFFNQKYLEILQFIRTVCYFNISLFNLFLWWQRRIFSSQCHMILQQSFQNSDLLLKYYWCLIIINGSYYCHIFFFFAFCLYYTIGQIRTDRKQSGREIGAGFEMGTPVCRRAAHKDISSNIRVEWGGNAPLRTVQFFSVK